MNIFKSGFTQWRAALAVAQGGMLIGFMQTGVGAVLRNVYWKMLDILPTPQDYLLPGDVDDTGALQRLFAAHDRVLLNSEYLVSETIAIRDGMYIQSDGAVILRDTSNSSILVAINVNEWTIDGHLTLQGTGNNLGSAKALSIVGCNRYNVRGVYTKDIDGWGFHQAPGNYEAPLGDQGQFTDCRSTGCHYSMANEGGSGAEFCTWTNYQVTTCTYGPTIIAGNTVFIGGNCVENQGGMTVLGGPNHAHGITGTMNINHNVAWNIKLVDVTNGHDFVGVHAYGDDAAGTGKIHIVNSKGVKFTGGMVDARIDCDGADSAAFFDGVTFPGNYTSKAGANPENIRISGCHTLSGSSRLNDPSPVFVMAQRTGAPQALVNNATLVWDTKSIDNRNRYNAATGAFTAITDGGNQVFSFNVSATISADSGLADGSYLDIKVNGASAPSFIPLTALSGTLASANGTAHLVLTNEDVVTVAVVLAGAPVNPVLATGSSRITVALKV